MCSSMTLAGSSRAEPSRAEPLDRRVVRENNDDEFNNRQRWRLTRLAARTGPVWSLPLLRAQLVRSSWAEPRRDGVSQLWRRCMSQLRARLVRPAHVVLRVIQVDRVSKWDRYPSGPLTPPSTEGLSPV